MIEPPFEEDGGGFLATVPELPGCLSDGETRAEALENVENAIAAWIPCARKMASRFRSLGFTIHGLRRRDLHAATLRRGRAPGASRPP